MVGHKTLCRIDYTVFLAMVAVITCFSSVAFAASNQAANTTVNQSQSKIIFSSGIGNTSTSGNPLFSIDKGHGAPTCSDTSGHCVNGQIVSVGQEVSPGLCLDSDGRGLLERSKLNINVCGQNIEIIPILNRGSIFRMKAPYIPDPYTVKCEAKNVGFGWVVDTSKVTCNLLQCPDSNLPLCGVQLPVPGGAGVGQVIKISVPDTIGSFTGNNLSVSVQCVVSNDKADYQLIDTSEVSCNVSP